MPSKLKEFPKIPGRGRPEMYDWDKLFDGTVWSLKRGTDFDVDPSSFRSNVYVAAKRHGVKVRTTITDEDTIVLQAESE